MNHFTTKLLTRYFLSPNSTQLILILVSRESISDIVGTGRDLSESCTYIHVRITLQLPITIVHQTINNLTIQPFNFIPF
ncbi:hypothetical protein SAMN05444128_2226 [Pontibacter indicus]|uniref:Uncharacterized protein n=1 Tax=Pontibacter indicus TaxID=1317125 RepID=A0A1R3XFL4_9BACT|nr:hypothetical protein SAMN05444128_2226 [Pontibacter indicus]